MRAAHCSQLLSDTYERNILGGGRSWPVKSGGHKSRWEEKKLAKKGGVVRVGVPWKKKKRKEKGAISFL